MAITVYPYFNEEIYHSKKYKPCFSIFASGKIRETLSKMGVTENYGIFIKNTDYHQFMKMRHKNDTCKIFDVNASLQDGTIIPCTCFLSVKEEYIEELETTRKIASGIIIDKTDKDKLNWAYRYNAMQDEMEEW